MIKKIKKKDVLPSGWNPRSRRDPKKLEDLKRSIQTKGCLGPPIVRSHPTQPGKYIITAGRGRLEAYHDEDEIEVIVLDEDELSAKLTSLIENKVREDVSDVDNERFIAEIYDEGLVQGRWQSALEMAALEELPQEDISKSILAYKDRLALKLGDHLNRELSTTDINESRPLISQPELRIKLLTLRARGDIRGSGHIVHDIAKLLACAPDYAIQGFLTDKLDSRNLKNEILNIPIPTHHTTASVSLTQESTHSIDKKPSTEPSPKEIIRIPVQSSTPTSQPTPVIEPPKKITDVDRLRLIMCFAEYYKEISTMGIADIQDREMMKEAILQLESVTEKCTRVIEMYYYLLSVK